MLVRGQQDEFVQLSCFFFNDTATTEIYTLSLHDALPIYFTLWGRVGGCKVQRKFSVQVQNCPLDTMPRSHTIRGVEETKRRRSEEHTSELQSRQYLVCRLLLAKKTNLHTTRPAYTGDLRP